MNGKLRHFLGMERAMGLHLNSPHTSRYLAPLQSDVLLDP
jgi:hypothetical protein